LTQSVRAVTRHVSKRARCARSRARELHGKFKFYVDKSPPSPPDAFAAGRDFVGSVLFSRVRRLFYTRDACRI